MDIFHLSFSKSGENYQTTLLFHKIRLIRKLTISIQMFSIYEFKFHKKYISQ